MKDFYYSHMTHFELLSSVPNITPWYTVEMLFYNHLLIRNLTRSSSILFTPKNIDSHWPWGAEALGGRNLVKEKKGPEPRILRNTYLRRRTMKSSQWNNSRSELGTRKYSVCQGSQKGGSFKQEKYLAVSKESREGQLEEAWCYCYSEVPKK